jgi:hypothetical protein
LLILLSCSLPLVDAGAGVGGTNGWDEAMLRARNQAEQYAKALPATAGWPPFLIVADVGYSILLFADFSGTGKAYVPFPDSPTHRIFLEELESNEIRGPLRAILARTFCTRPKPHLRPRYQRRRLAARELGPGSRKEPPAPKRSRLS